MSREVTNGNGAPDPSQLRASLDRLWDAKRIREYLNVSDRWLRRAMSASQFPRPDFRLNRTHGMRWKQSTIDAYLESKTTSDGVPSR